jgi:recombination protein RecT
MTNETSLVTAIQGMAPQLEAALPKHIDPGRIARVAMTAVRQNTKLAACSRESFLGGLLVASQMGLEINTPLGHAYLIPYGNKATLVVGYKGIMDLAYRTGLCKTISAEVVYENDDFDYELGIKKTLSHKPPKRGERGEAIGYYGYYLLENGGFDFSYWTHEQVVAHGKKFSKSFGSGPWKTNFDQMAKKTVIKSALNYAPMALEHRDTWALAAGDDSVHTYSDDAKRIVDVDHLKAEGEPEPIEVAIDGLGE